MESIPPGQSYPSQPAPKKKGCGCFGLGCLIVLIILAVIGGAAGFGLYKLGSSLRDQYTGDHSVPVQIYPATDAQYQAVASRLQAFRTNLASNQTATLELTADDLNVLIAKDPQFSSAAGKIYFTIPGNLLGLDLSAPLGQYPLLKGRWFNGKGTLFLEIRKGALSVRPRSVQAGGKVLPDEYIEGLAPSFEEGVKEGLLETPGVQEMVRRVQSLEVRDGKVIIVAGP